jgi:hypothetical protein
MTGKMFGLAILIVSLTIALASLFIVLSNLGVRGSDPMAVGLGAIVAILILLIISMIWSIGKGLNKGPDEEIR